MLHAERLTCIVDDRPLFAALTLSLAAGELLQVAGDNGAGKTSLLRILCGLARPESGVVSWQGQLLAALLVMDRLFRDDWQDGSLEQLMLLPTPLVAVVLVKVVAHWMMSGLPLLIVSPLAALLLGMSLHDAGVLALTLLLGTPTLSFLGAVGVGLTVGLKRGGVLLSLLVLPLAVPLLIFATAACQAAAAGLPVSGYLAMLAAFLTASATLCPFATAAALRLTVQ